MERQLFSRCAWKTNAHEVKGQRHQLPLIDRVSTSHTSCSSNDIYIYIYIYILTVMVLIIDMLRACLFGESRPELVKPTTVRHLAESGNPCSSPPSLPSDPRASKSSDLQLKIPHDRRAPATTSLHHPHQGSRASPQHRQSAPPPQPIAKPTPRRRETNMKILRPARSASGATTPSLKGEPKSQFNRDIMLLQRQYDELCAKMHSLSTKRAQELQQRPLQRQNQTCFRTHRKREHASRTKAAMLTITPQPRETLTPAFSTCDH